MQFEFQEKNSFENRVKESSRVMTNYPDRVPVIIQKMKDSDIPTIDKCKYIVPKDLTVAEFLVVLRKRIKLKPEQAIFLILSDHTLPPVSRLVSQVYKTHKDTDGFLYIIYAGESCFGCEWVSVSGYE